MSERDRVTQRRERTASHFECLRVCSRLHDADAVFFFLRQAEEEV